MKRSMKSLVEVFTLMLMAVILAACGGGGGGGAAPAACVDTTWLPQQDTIQDGKSYIQTSNCGNQRTNIGTKSLWILREATSLDSTLFKSFVTETVVDAAPDGSGGVVSFGTDSAAINNKGVVVRMDNQGNELWRSLIDSPLGNTLEAKSISSDGIRNVTIFSRKPLNQTFVYGIGMDGSPRVLGDVYIGTNLTNVTTAFDGNNLLIGTIDNAGVSNLILQSMIVNVIPPTVNPLVKPEFITPVADGILIGSGDQMGKYSKDLTTFLQASSWLPIGNAKIHSVVNHAGNVYIAGEANGNLVFTQIGNPSFRNTVAIPVGTDKIQIGFDSLGNMYLTIGGRVGKVDILTGEMATVKPLAIPPNVKWFISGAKMYFVSNGSTIDALDLSKL